MRAGGVKGCLMVVDMLVGASVGVAGKDVGGSRDGLDLAGETGASRIGGRAPVCLVGRGGCAGRSGCRAGGGGARSGCLAGCGAPPLIGKGGNCTGSGARCLAGA